MGNYCRQACVPTGAAKAWHRRGARQAANQHSLLALVSLAVVRSFQEILECAQGLSEDQIKVGSRRTMHVCLHVHSCKHILYPHLISSTSSPQEQMG